MSKIEVVMDETPKMISRNQTLKHGEAKPESSSSESLYSKQASS
jgi:hypothetical protein